MKEVTPLQKWFNNYKLTHSEITSKVIAERMKVSDAMFTYLLSGERELTLNRFNTLIDALDIY